MGNVGRRVGFLLTAKLFILLDSPRYYDGEQSRDALLHALALHFKGYSKELQNLLDFWQKLESAKLYGLVTMGFDISTGVENLRELVKLTEEMEAKPTVFGAGPNV